VVFVSGAAGAVGSVAGQLARARGAARVIGSAGGPAKARRLVEDFGFDAGIDYRAGSVAEQLAAAAPEGIDVYVDNVGGEQLEAALDALRHGGRVALVGAISQYNATGPVAGPGNLFWPSPRRSPCGACRSATTSTASASSSRTPPPGSPTAACAHTRRSTRGSSRRPAAFLGVMSGKNVGKMLVRLG
jgi:NADPH-dependent curcumin reductase CurA